MGETPGTVMRIDPSDPRAWGASTHTLPLPVFCRYLEETLGCDVVLLGIEPVDTSFGEGLTPAVNRAVALAVREALGCFESAPCAPSPPPANSAGMGRQVQAGGGAGVGAREARRLSLDAKEQVS
jgi:hypothetical protein